MSGTVVNNVARASGTIAATPGGLDWSTAVVTGSTVTVEAGRGYFINTTSNACTVTLPASPEVGDQIVLADYARTWASNAVTLDSNGNNFQGESDAFIVNYDTVGQSLNIVFSDSTQGWLPVSDDAVADVPYIPVTQKAIFAYGKTSGSVSMSNLVNSSGVIAADVSGVGTAREGLASVTYGNDKGLFAYGIASSSIVSMSNKVNTSGVVAADVTGVGTARTYLAGTTYGFDKGIFAYGYTGSNTNLSNLVSNSGVVAADTTGVGSARLLLAAARYGVGKALFSFGRDAEVTNLVTDQGVIGSDVTGVGTERNGLGASSYGDDKAIFAFGYSDGGGANTNVSNKVSNVGVVASDTTGVGTAREQIGACSYGGDKGVFAYGFAPGAARSMKNLVSNTGVVAADVTGVGTARRFACGVGFSLSA